MWLVVEVTAFVAAVAGLFAMDARFELGLDDADIAPVRAFHRGVGVELEAIRIVSPVCLLDSACEGSREE